MAAAVPIIALAAVSALTAGVGAYTQYQQAKTNARGLEAQANAERRSAYAREREARRAGQLTLKRQQLVIAKSGLLNEGSPLEQLSRNAFEVEYTALSARNAGLDRAENLRWQGHTEKQAARRNIGVAIGMGLIGGAAKGYAQYGGSAPAEKKTTGTTPGAGTGTDLLSSQGPGA